MEELKEMKQSKLKYFGICATALLTIAPMATNVLSIAAQPIAPVSVKADAKSDYQNSLNDGFNTSVNVPISNVRNLAAFEGTYRDGSIIYDNYLSSATSTSLLKTNDAYKGLTDSLNYGLLQLFVKNGATVKFLGNPNYKTAIKVTGSRVDSVTTSAGVIRQLKTLNVGDSFTVELTTTDGYSPVGSIKMTATIVNDSAKPTINPIADLSSGSRGEKITDGYDTSLTQNSSDVAAVIKDSAGRQIYSSTELSDLNGKYYYQTAGTDKPITSNYPVYKLNADSKVTIVKQYIPVPYTKTIAERYDSSNFTFLEETSTSGVAKVTTTVPTPGVGAVAYLVRNVVVGNPVSTDYPVFRYSSTDSSGTTTIATVKNGETLQPNRYDSQYLTYNYDNQATLNTMENYLNDTFQKTTNGAGQLKAYQVVNNNNQESLDATNMSNITFQLPVVRPTSSPQYVYASVSNKVTGVSSTIKIPVTVKGIPNAATPPTVTKFPANDQLAVNSRTTSSIDPKSIVAATYVDGAGKTQDLPNANISVSVKNSSGADVSLNSNGTIPTTTNGTYKVHYVFTNPNDALQKRERDLTLNVNSTDLAAPSVTGFNDNAIYTLSNNRQKEVSPFATVLKMANVKATYVGANGSTYTIDPSKVTYKITNKAGQTVALNSAGNISMANPDTYTVTYIWTNPEDSSKTTTKTMTLIVNSVISQPISAKYAGSEVANPTIETGTSFNVLNNLSFSLSYTDPATSTPNAVVSETIPNNAIAVTVTKDGKTVDLTNNVFTPSEEGTYTVNYQVTNPKDNAIVTNYTRTVTAKKPTPTGPTITERNGVVWIKYDWGYGVNLWKSPSVNNGAELNPDGSYRKLMTGTAWKYSAVATYPDGSKWYKLGTNQWVSENYVSFTELVNPNANDWQITNTSGVGVVNYVPGYGINVWTSPDQKAWTKKIRHNTAWKYFKVAKKGNTVMYNLGGNQWVDATFFLPLNR